MADSEVTPSLAEILLEHSQVYTDEGSIGCCCGYNGSDRAWSEHVAAALQASFVLVPKDQLHQETATVPEWVLNDPPEMDERHVIPTPKKHVEWVTKSRWVGSWSPA